MFNLSSRMEHYLGFSVLIVLSYFFILVPVLSHVFPPEKPVNNSVYVEKINKLETEINGLQGTIKLYAEAKGAPPAYQMPAINVVEKIDHCGGLSQTQCGQILSALKPKTVEKVAVAVSPPTPAPTPATKQGQEIYQAAYAADTAVMNKTKYNIVISRQEVPRSKIGSYLSPRGQGISYEIYRRNQTAIEAAVFQANTHLAPGIGLHYVIPHTVLSLGPSIEYDHGIKFDFSAVVGF